jgi:hypothetical protein
MTTSEPANPIIGKPNWTAASAVQEARDAATEVQKADNRRSVHLCVALSHTFSLIFDWRHDQARKAALADYMGKKNAPKEGNDKRGYNRDVLAFVKCVFLAEGAKQWTWHANALRQAFAAKQEPDTIGTYFHTTSPTAAAAVWTKAHKKAMPAPALVAFQTLDPKLAAIFTGDKAPIKVTLRPCQDCEAGVEIAVPAAKLPKEPEPAAEAPKPGVRKAAKAEATA